MFIMPLSQARSLTPDGSSALRTEGAIVRVSPFPSRSRSPFPKTSVPLLRPGFLEIPSFEVNSEMPEGHHRRMSLQTSRPSMA